MHINTLNKKTCGRLQTPSIYVVLVNWESADRLDRSRSLRLGHWNRKRVQTKWRIVAQFLFLDLENSFKTSTKDDYLETLFGGRVIMVKISLVR